MATRKSADEDRGPSRKRRRGVLAVVALGLGVPVLASLILLVVYLHAEIALKFEGRLWTLPARVYSARLTIVPGASLDAATLAARLERSGYARTEAEPEGPGQFRARGGVVEANLRSFDEGGGPALPARRVRIRFDGRHVAALEDAKGRALARVEVEPELLSAVFGARREDRRLVLLKDVPDGFVKAVLAAEDARFYEHAGFDPLAIVRAAFANVRSGRIVQGASTITQQTVKNLYLDQERTWWRKLREVVMAVVLDLRYPKDRILEVYLNEVYLGQRGSVAICGAETAARFYFGRGLADLTTGERALLAGLIRNPGGYNPFQHADRALERRKQVLAAMVDQGWLSADDARKAGDEPLRLASGGAGYARAPYAIDFVRSQLAEFYTSEELSDEGLRIFTTIDTDVQERAEQALRDGLERLEREVPSVRRQMRERRLQGSVVVIDPGTGEILALVGGRDYRESQFDRAVQARRQPGSCFKAFVYLAALEAAAAGRAGGVTPATILEDEPVEITSGGKTWSPANYDGEFHGPVPARQALEQSRNVPAVRVAQSVGLDSVVAAATRCGIGSSLEPLPSLALGAQEVAPLDLAAAYATLANGGVRLAPSVVREVVAAGGRRLRRSAPQPERAAGAASVYVLDDMLRGVLTRGTAATSSALGFAGDAAGKTGTTDDTRDAWFVGFTPRLAVLVWVGYDDNAKTGLTGASGALPIWVSLMNGIRWRWEGPSFLEPEGVVRVEIDPETGERAVAACPSRVEEIFVAGTEPQDDCRKHAGGFKNWLRNLFQRRKG